MKRRKQNLFGKSYEEIVYWLGTIFPGLVFVFLGISLLPKEDVSSDMLNIWSFLYGIGIYAIALWKIDEVINRKRRATDSKQNISSWRLILSLAWFMLSAIFALWTYKNVSALINTDGLALIAIGFAPFTLYTDYRGNA